MSASVWQTTLKEFQAEVAAPQPAPAGVATSCVAAALGLSLLVKVLRIKGKHDNLIPSALDLIEELQSTADADIAAVRNYIQTRDAKPLKEVPQRAEHLVAQALILCAAVSDSVTGLIAADVAAATALLEGAANAIAACVAANG
jgi:formiminotetrahydrofolate cyclodeaminase